MDRRRPQLAAISNANCNFDEREIVECTLHRWGHTRRYVWFKVVSLPTGHPIAPDWDQVATHALLRAASAVRGYEYPLLANIRSNMSACLHGCKDAEL